MSGQTVMDLAVQLEQRRSEVDGVLQEICERFDELTGLNIDIGWGNGFYIDVQWITHDDDKPHSLQGETLIGVLRGVLRALEAGVPTKKEAQEL